MERDPAVRIKIVPWRTARASADQRLEIAVTSATATNGEGTQIAKRAKD
jgi:hypothetical protein